MANLLTRKQIAELIGKTPGYVGIYVQRKKLIEENKRIDTDNPTNKAFISKYITKEVERVSESEIYETNQNKGKVNQGNIDYIKAQYDLKLKQSKLEEQELSNKKNKAKIVPVDFITQLFSIYFKGNITDILNSVNKSIDKLVDELEGNYQTKLAYKKELKVNINKVINDNHEKLSKEIIEKAKEYALSTKW